MYIATYIEKTIYNFFPLKHDKNRKYSEHVSARLVFFSDFLYNSNMKSKHKKISSITLLCLYLHLLRFAWNNHSLEYQLSLYTSIYLSFVQVSWINDKSADMDTIIKSVTRCQRLQLVKIYLLLKQLIWYFWQLSIHQHNVPKSSFLPTL